MTKKGLLLILLCIAILGHSASTEAQDLPLVIQAKLMLKVVTFDHNFSKRVAGGVVNVGVLEYSADSDSQSNADELKGLLGKMSSIKIKGHSFKVVPIIYNDPLKLSSAISEANLAMLYVTKGNDAHINAISEATREAKVLSLSGNVSYVKDVLSIGFGIENKKPKIYANVQALNAEEIAMAAKFINNMAKKVKE